MEYKIHFVTIRGIQNAFYDLFVLVGDPYCGVSSSPSEHEHEQ